MFEAFESWVRRKSPWTRGDEPAWGGWTGVVLTPKDGPVLASTEGPIGQQTQGPCNMISIGVGAEYAMGWAEAAWKHNKAYWTKGKLARKTIKAVARRYAFVAKPVVVYEVTPE